MSRATLRPALSGAGIFPDKNAIVTVAVVSVVYVVGWWLPLPGVNFERMFEYSPLNSDTMARVSILALGVIPLFTILAYAELAKLAFPSLARWRTASPENDARFSSTVLRVRTQ